MANHRQLWMNDTWLNLLKQSNIIGTTSSIALDDEKTKVKTDNKLPNRIWSIEPHELENNYNRVRRASNITMDSNLNTHFNVDVDSQVLFPFSPYIDSYFRRIRREIEKTAEDKIDKKSDFMLNESFISGQLKVIRILSSLLKE
eukprot:399398_1